MARWRCSPGPVGQIRSTGVCILLSIVTIGIYSAYWYYKVHEEMKRHSGQAWRSGGPASGAVRRHRDALHHLVGGG
ncbi:MAG: DUF4234 domain-containing protein [Nocardioidaceae bacterium]